MIESVLAGIFSIGGVILFASGALLLGCILILVAALCGMQSDPHPL